jgi:hypothetical protein
MKFLVSPRMIAPLSPSAREDAVRSMLARVTNTTDLRFVKRRDEREAKTICSAYSANPISLANGAIRLAGLTLEIVHRATLELEHHNFAGPANIIRPPGRILGESA